MREELGEQAQSQSESEQEDNRQPRDPRDPEDRGTASPEDPASDPNDPRADLHPWMVSLPPQVRDAFVRRDFEIVPPRYRRFVERYFLWLLEEERRQSTGR